MLPFILYWPWSGNIKVAYKNVASFNTHYGTGSVHINSKEMVLKCFPGLETWQKGSNECELIEIASKLLKSELN